MNGLGGIFDRFDMWLFGYLESGRDWRTAALKPSTWFSTHNKAVDKRGRQVHVFIIMKESVFGVYCSVVYCSVVYFVYRSSIKRKSLYLVPCSARISGCPTDGRAAVAKLLLYIQ